MKKTRVQALVMSAVLTLILPFSAAAAEDNDHRKANDSMDHSPDSHCNESMAKQPCCFAQTVDKPQVVSS